MAAPILPRNCSVPLYALLVLWATAVLASGPTLTASLDTTRITLGDPLHLRLAVDRDEGQQTLFPEPDDELAPCSVHSTTPATTTDLPGGRQRDERVYELRTYTLEAESIAPVGVAVITETGDTLHLQSESLAIVVDRVRDAEGDEELRAIKPPLHIPGGLPLWLVGILGAALAVGLAFLARRFLRRTPVEVAPTAPMPRGPVDYVREFARIGDMGLLERGATKLYYTRLADVMWRFLEDRVGIDALDRTTGEIGMDLQLTDRIDAATADRVIRFLETADLVKFARASPPVEEAGRAPEDGAGIVGDVEALRRAQTATPTTAQQAEV